VYVEIHTDKQSVRQLIELINQNTTDRIV